MFSCLYFSDLSTPPPSFNTEKRSSAKQDSFKKKLFRRHNAYLPDVNCEICTGGTTESLEAAHLYDVAFKAQLEQKYMTKPSRLPISVNDVDNGLLLCPTCHTLFDNKNRDLRIGEDGTIIVSSAA
jgi:predicted restriction endonuclease